MTETTDRNWNGDDFSAAEYAAIAAILRDRRSFELDQYKDRCVRRRIAKRLRDCRATDFASYLVRLAQDDDEMDALLATISIYVSQFFRNLDTFRILEQEILPDLCRRARDAGRRELTPWSAGCASGEEAYSLALLADDLETDGIRIRILATDINQSILDAARDGLFDASRLQEMPQEVRDRYFRLEGGRYRLLERVRDKVEFLRHNVMTSGNYPAAELILCRNVLIYFTRPEQERILTRFATALPPYGVLVLGRSEAMAGNARDYYQSEFPVERIYRRTAGPAPSIVP